jgi:hypothetical protein
MAKRGIPVLDKTRPFATVAHGDLGDETGEAVQERVAFVQDGHEFAPSGKYLSTNGNPAPPEPEAPIAASKVDTIEAVREDVETPAMARAEMLARMADSYSKMTAATAKASPELARFAVATDLLKDLARFVHERFPRHATVVAEILEPFAADIAQRYG